MPIQCKDLGDHRWVLKYYPPPGESSEQFLQWIAQYRDRCGIWNNNGYGQLHYVEVRSRDMPLQTLIALRWS